MKMKFAIVLLAASSTSAAFGQDSAEDDPLSELRVCQNNAEPDARLACYDRVSAEILGAADAGALRVVEREEVRETRRKLFGFSLPELGIFKSDKTSDKEEEEFKVLETTIAGVRGSHRQGYVITTAEGAVWQITDIPGRLLSPKVGQPIEFRNAALSSYFVRINGQRGVKGTRLR